MDKLIKKIIERVVYIPHDFNNEDKSVFTLLNESGYFEYHDQINEIDIIEVLKIHPQLIAEWLQLSDDNRSSVKWVLSRGDSGKYFVGHWPGGKDFEQIATSDEFYACAAFIKRHIESIRVLFKK